MGKDFGISIESYHLPGKGDLENVHQLPPDKLARREVVIIDIAAELSDQVDYSPDEDPSQFKSQKCDRGPLKPGWMNSVSPNLHYSTMNSVFSF